MKLKSGLGAVVGRDGGGSRPAILLRRWPLVLAIGILLAIAVGVVTWYAQLSQLSEPEQKAVEAARTEAKGFNEKDKQYTYTQLNQAVMLAYDKKCAEASAVFDDAQRRPNGITAAYMQRIKQRIDSTCSVPATASPQSND